MSGDLRGTVGRNEEVGENDVGGNDEAGADETIAGSDEVDARVAAALSRADELASTSPEEHVAIYEDVHETLQQVLAQAGTAPGSNRASTSDGPREPATEPMSRDAAEDRSAEDPAT